MKSSEIPCSKYRKINKPQPVNVNPLKTNE